MNQFDKLASEYADMETVTKKYVGIPTLFNMLGNVEGRSVLELGCGAGFYTARIALRKPKTITGVDVSEEMLKRARRASEENNLDIEYIAEKIENFRAPQKFDIAVSVMALNFANTQGQLTAMCKSAFSNLKPGGKFVSITINPNLHPDNEFFMERKHVSASGKDIFENGDKILCVIEEDRKDLFVIEHYYRDKQTYEEALKEAGFLSVDWVNPTISEEGKKKYGDAMWNRYMQNHATIGLVAKK